MSQILPSPRDCCNPCETPVVQNIPGPAGRDGRDGAGYYATTADSLLIAEGLKMFVTQPSLAYSPGARVRLSAQTSPNSWMEGAVIAYDSATGEMTVNVSLTNGSGVFVGWNLNLAGEPGAGGGGGGGEHELEFDNGNSGDSIVIDWNQSSFQKLTLTDNCVLSFINRTDARRLTLRLVQDSTGSRRVVYPDSARFPGGVTPTLTAMPHAVDLVEFYFNGQNYFLVNAVFQLMPQIESP